PRRNQPQANKHSRGVRSAWSFFSLLSVRPTFGHFFARSSRVSGTVPILRSPETRRAPSFVGFAPPPQSFVPQILTSFFAASISYPVLPMLPAARPRFPLAHSAASRAFSRLVPGGKSDTTTSLSVNRSATVVPSFRVPSHSPRRFSLQSPVTPSAPFGG